MKTYTPTPRDIERRWYVVDAEGAVLGRLATEVAQVLRGKHKPIFAPHMDTGDHVIVVNARGVRLTGGKETKKIEYRHSGYPGGLRETLYERLLAERPAHAVEKAIRGMLPKNRLGRAMIRKLQVYEGAEHPHSAQKPVSLALGQIPEWSGLPERKPPPERVTPAAAKRTPKRGAGTAATGDRSAGGSPRSSSKPTPASGRKSAVERAPGSSRRNKREET
jgi:large subunit ribosomal protein L13